MYLKDIADDFLKAQGYAPATAAQYKQRLMWLSPFEQKESKPIYLFSENRLREILGQVTTSLPVIKSIIMLLNFYFIWLDGKGIDTSAGIEIVSNISPKSVINGNQNLYFYSIQHLLRKLKMDVKHAAQIEQKSPTDYRVALSTIILLWYGIRINEIIKIKKKDVLDETNVLTFKRTRYLINSDAYQILKECALASFYTKNNPSGVCTIPYADSEYLLRSSNRGELDVKYLSNSMSDFNGTLKESSSPYRIEKIFQSGFYRRMYDKERELGGRPYLLNPVDRREYFKDLFGGQISETQSMNSRINDYLEYVACLENRID